MQEHERLNEPGRYANWGYNQASTHLCIACLSPRRGKWDISPPFFLGLAGFWTAGAVAASGLACNEYMAQLRGVALLTPFLVLSSPAKPAGSECVCVL